MVMPHLAPATLREKPAYFLVTPLMISFAPDAANGSAEAATAIATASSGDAEMTLGEPTTISGEADAMIGEPETRFGEPAATIGDAETISGDSAATFGEPETTFGDSETTSVEPEVISKNAKPAVEIAEPAGNEPNPANPAINTKLSLDGRWCLGILKGFAHPAQGCAPRATLGKNP